MSNEVYTGNWNFYIRSIELIVEEIKHNKALMDQYMVLQNKARYDKLALYQVQTAQDLTSAVNQLNEFIKGVELTDNQHKTIEQINNNLIMLDHITVPYNG